MNVKQILKKVMPQKIIAGHSRFVEVRKIIRNTKPQYPRECPFCGYKGYFNSYGTPPRTDAQCRQCFSLERTRLFYDWFQTNKETVAEPVLHIAPEAILEDKFRQMYKDYATADLFVDADLKVDIEDINLPDESYATVICNHVLEHVNDKKAMTELYRILKPGGRLFASVPIVEGWAQTYENEEITCPEMRSLHFGQDNHVRFYGADFRDRLKMAGFAKVEDVTAEGEKVIRMGLMRGEKFFICYKSA